MAPVEPGNGMSARPGEPAGAEASARLLLALTALYVQRSNHGADEQQQFTALALGLIDRADPAVCAAAAARLRGHPDAPAVVLDRLDAAAAAGGDGVRQEGPDDASEDAPEDGPEDGVREESLEDGLQESGVQEPGVREDAVREDAAREEGGEPGWEPLSPEFGKAFLAASPAERRAMLSAAVAGGRDEAAPEGCGRFHVRIDVSPWRGRTGVFARDFARLIDAPRSLSERILNDPSGEPLVIAARATGMPLAVLQRILVLASSAMHPVERVWELSELYDAVDAGTARDLLAAWRAAAAGDGGEAAAEPACDPGCEPADEPVTEPAGAATSLGARLRALSARVEGKGVMPRSGPGSAGRRDPPSR